MIRTAFTILVLVLLLPRHVFADWPRLQFPDGAKVVTIGEQVRLNGMPMKMYQVFNSKNLEMTTQFYKAALGSKYAKTKVAHGLVLSQLKANHLITIRITPLNPSLTEVLVSIGDLKAANDNRGRPLGVGLPMDSRVASDMESIDQGKNSRQLVYINRHPLDFNASFLINMLSMKGYQLEPIRSSSTLDSKTLSFEGEKKEASAVIINQNGVSSVVLTTIQTP
jgi:hypothetical protein